MKAISKIMIYLFLLAVISNAQVLKVTASLQYDHLPQEEQDDLSTFADKVEQYFNGYTWIEDEFQYDVTCNVQVIVETVQKKTFEKMYKTQFLISSVSGENFYDKSWEFPYQESAPLNYSKAQFDPLTHLLDFYAYMVLAGEMDTNGLLLGTPLYDKAMDIANQAMLSQYPRGWNIRIAELQKITDVRARPLREIKPHLFEALYFLDEDKPMAAYREALKVLDGIKKVYGVLPNSKPMQTFFKSHYRELASLFRGHNNELNRLIEYDSKHREAYRDMLE